MGPIAQPAAGAARAAVCGGGVCYALPTVQQGNTLTTFGTLIRNILVHIVHPQVRPVPGLPADEGNICLLAAGPEEREQNREASGAIPYSHCLKHNLHFFAMPAWHASSPHWFRLASGDP